MFMKAQEEMKKIKTQSLFWLRERRRRISLFFAFDGRLI
jgi:hypothetical protein